MVINIQWHTVLDFVHNIKLMINYPLKELPFHDLAFKPHSKSLYSDFIAFQFSISHTWAGMARSDSISILHFSLLEAQFQNLEAANETLH